MKIPLTLPTCGRSPTQDTSPPCPLNILPGTFLERTARLVSMYCKSLTYVVVGSFGLIKWEATYCVLCRPDQVGSNLLCIVSA
jgi:hypothetical protein